MQPDQKLQDSGHTDADVWAPRSSAVTSGSGECTQSTKCTQCMQCTLDSLLFRLSFRMWRKKGKNILCLMHQLIRIKNNLMLKYYYYYLYYDYYFFFLTKADEE